MNSGTSIDYAVFQLSPDPEHSRYELFVTWNGETEKLASGFFKPSISHLKIDEEQIARESTSIKLEVERSRNENSWFNKGTIEREEFLKATDMRLISLKQDLATSCSRAVSAGFCDKSVSDLLLFAEYIGANRLNSQSLCLYVTKAQLMGKLDPVLAPLQNASVIQPSQPNTTNLSEKLEHAQPTQQHFDMAVPEEPFLSGSSAKDPSPCSGGNSRRLSVQDRINLFENKQKELSASSKNVSSSSVSNTLIQTKGEHRRLSSHVPEKSVFGRWGDMGFESHRSNTSFNCKNRGGVAIGTSTSGNFLYLSQNRTRVTEITSLKDSATSQCRLDVKGHKAPSPCSTLTSSFSFYNGLTGDRNCNEEDQKASNLMTMARTIRAYIT
ncbi:hypothetical protein ZIOFF_020663 [Zingiber officinale]|uniref:Uncharacterized protein n=1 Tax=Zingiber officinale TaxID=94328 RepID=A0A8J5LJ12_ZINOF|nr:hypothetical protein ZIOFF_020663 [Zingiber officinale]